MGDRIASGIGYVLGVILFGWVILSVFDPPSSLHTDSWFAAFNRMLMDSDWDVEEDMSTVRPIAPITRHLLDSAACCV